MNKGEERSSLSESAVYENAFGYHSVARFKRLLAILFIFVLIVGAGFIYIERHYVSIVVTGKSMEATLSDGDCVILKKTKDINRGDIVVVDVKNYKNFFSGNLIIKRVIGFEGDEIYCDDSHNLYRKIAGEEDFTLLKEDYISSRTPAFSTVTVGEGEFFFLGDNRAMSQDSTEVGCLPVSCILGRVSEWSLGIRGITGFLNGIKEMLCG